MAVFRGLRIPRKNYPIPPLADDQIYNRLTSKGDQAVSLTGAQVLASDGYSEHNDTSTLVGEKGYSHMYSNIVDTAKNITSDLRGDFLIYGWRPWGQLVAILVVICFFLFNFTLIAALRGDEANWFMDWPGVILNVVLIFLGFWWYFRSPFSHYIVFDRRNKLIHLPRWFSHKQDSIRWNDADLCVLDGTAGAFNEYISTELRVVPPPFSLKQHGSKPWYRYPIFHYDSKRPNKKSEIFEGYPIEGAEMVFRFVVDFMTKPPEQSRALDAMCFDDIDIQMEHFGNNNFEEAVRKHKKLWSLIDPEKLPTEPNWVKDAQGNWQQVRPAVRARFGWFGLWNKSYTLPPHLRGTKADPAFKDDPNAPELIHRWYSVENEGTADLVGQPAEVLAAVLRGEGMPSPESLAQTRLPEGGWPGPWLNWHTQFEETTQNETQLDNKPNKEVN